MINRQVDLKMRRNPRVLNRRVKIGRQAHLLRAAHPVHRMALAIVGQQFDLQFARMVSIGSRLEPHIRPANHEVHAVALGRSSQLGVFPRARRIRRRLHEAVERIEQGLRGERSLPDAIILDLNLLDLNLGHENGYEALLQWRTIWANSAMRMIVWSALAEHNAQLCALFHVDAFVSKWKGEAALHEALRDVIGKRPEAI